MHINMDCPDEVILITGGSGFLGQHIIRLLQERDQTVKEIRVVDINPYSQQLDHSSHIPIKSYIGDICIPDTIRDAFHNVNCVYHCAALIDFQYPINVEGLNRVNVTGTQNIIDLCIEFNVGRLIFTSDAAVSMTPYLGSTFSLIINQTENTAKVPTSSKGYLIQGYPESKFLAEKLVLATHGTRLANGQDTIATVVLRPTLMYGEEDKTFFTNVISLADKFGGQIPRISGQGGKHQLVYAGNVAYAHMLAKNVLKQSPAKIGGLPIFITDDTPIEDVTRFAQRISKSTATLKLRPSWWSLPGFLVYLIAFIFELIITMAQPIIKLNMKYQLKSLCAYAGSLVMFSRLRAAIHLDYEPIYSEEKSILNSAIWYEKWYIKYENRKMKNMTR